MQAGTAVSEGRVQGSAVHEHGGERVQVQLLAGGGASVPLPSRARGPELKLRLLHLYRQAHTHSTHAQPVTIALIHGRRNFKDNTNP